MKPRKPISGRSLSQQHAALVWAGASPGFRLRWRLRATEDPGTASALPKEGAPDKVNLADLDAPPLGRAEKPKVHSPIVGEAPGPEQGGG